MGTCLSAKGGGNLEESRGCRGEKRLEEGSFEKKASDAEDLLRTAPWNKEVSAEH